MLTWTLKLCYLKGVAKALGLGIFFQTDTTLDPKVRTTSWYSKAM